MITIELLEKIEQLLPGRDDDSALRRRVVRILADAAGQLPLDALHAALGPGGRVDLALVASWDGLYWSTPRMVRLAPWVRHKLDLEEDRETPLQALLAGYDPEPCPYCNKRRIVHSGSQYACDGCRRHWTDSDTVPARSDPLAGVRAALARARNVSTLEDALAHARTGRVRLAS